MILVMGLTAGADSLAAEDPAGAPLPAVPYWLAANQGTVGEDGTAPLVRPKHTLRTIIEVLGINTTIWSYDRFIRESGQNPGFRIGFRSWQENFRNGFEWDDNNFATNQFAHPFHGNMYFNAARSNGHSFWESIPYTFAGSFLWEYMYEVHHPSYNDWVSTSIGGTAFGEMAFRLSDLVLDGGSSTRVGNWREVGSLVINPMRGLNRLISGEWGQKVPDAGDRRPAFLGLTFEAGLRTVGEEKLWEADTTRVFLEVQGTYGDPFEGDRDRPFDTMEVGALLNFGDASVLGGLKANGLLGAHELKESDNSRHLLGWFLNYEYVNTYAYETGGQSLGAGLLSRFKDTFLGPLDTEVHLNAIILGGVTSDYENFTGREYDYGPGSSLMLKVAFGKPGRKWLTASHNQHWIHTLNGTAGNHYLSITRLRTTVNLSRSAALGIQYLLYLSDSDYTDLPDVSKRFPEARVSLSLPLQ